MNMKKKVLSLGLILMLVLSSFSFAFGVDTVPEDTKQITIIHTNDTHARIESSDDSLGFAKVATLINQAKAEGKNVLVLDAGDTFHGQPVINTSTGENAVKILNATGYNYMVPGNHDFNYGTKRLIELSQKSEFKILCANFVDDKDKLVFTPYEIVDVDGVKVGIIGLSTPETAIKTSPANVEGYKFLDATETAQKMVTEIKDKTDVIVVLGHIGLDESSVVTSQQIIEKVDGIDVFIDGHSHSLLPEGKLVKNTLIASTQEYDKNLGFVELEVKDGQVTNKTAHLYPNKDAADLVPDETVAKVIAEVSEENKAINSVVVAKTDINLNGIKEEVRTKETNLGNLISDAVRKATNADIAFVNGGNIRDSIAVGDVTKEQVITVFPFGNLIMTKNVSGAILKDVLELSVSKYPSPQGGFLQVSGVTFKFDPSKEAGKRVSDIMVGANPVDSSANYVVAVNDFMAVGGDGYEMLKDCEQLPIEYPGYEEIMATYLNTNGTKGCEVSGRILAVETPVVEKPKTEEPKTEQPKVEEPKAAVKVEEPKVQEPVIEKPKMEEVVYIVVVDDSLWKIAQKYNTTWQELAKYNNLANPDLIFPGQTIKINK